MQLVLLRLHSDKLCNGLLLMLASGAGAAHAAKATYLTSLVVSYRMLTAGALLQALVQHMLLRLHSFTMLLMICLASLLLTIR